MSPTSIQGLLPPEAIVLAGGFGTRLRSVLPDRQKVIAPVAGEPFLARILRSFHAAGVRRVVLALCYRAADVLDVIGPLVPQGMTIEASVEHVPMGTGGAIRHALPLIGGADLLVANGDSVVDCPLVSLIEFHRLRRARATLLLCEVPDVSRYGTVNLGDDGQILSFREKQVQAHYPGIINAGVYMMSRDLVAGFPDGAHSLETAIFPELCGEGLYGLATRAPFIDIGVPDDYGRAAEFFSKLN
jgi:NDP-sugar pyrophosphorylase family protein